MTKGYKRTQRVSDLIQTTLARILQHDVKDLHLDTMITVTGVDVSHDLSFAKVFISVLDETKAAETIAALNHAAKNLRYTLANAVELRVVPLLKFIYDDSSVRGSRISSLINEAEKKQ